MFFFLLLPFSKSIFFPIIVVCTSKSTPSCITTCVAVVGIVLSCHLIGDKFSMKSSIIFCLSTPIFSIYFFNFGSFHAPKKNIGNSSYYDYPFFCFFLGINTAVVLFMFLLPSSSSTFLWLLWLWLLPKTGKRLFLLWQTTDVSSNFIVVDVSIEHERIEFIRLLTVPIRILKLTESVKKKVGTGISIGSVPSSES